MDKSIKWWAVLFWLALWQVASMAVGKDFLLPPPLRVLQTLWSLLGEPSFHLSILLSIGRIALGFFLALSAALICAPLSVRSRRFRELLAPPVFAMKTVPVASIIILILIWVSSKHLSVIISFMMVFPILYTSLHSGIANCDSQLLELAEVFSVSGTKKIGYLYFSEVLPHFVGGASVAVGLCWKAGVAAEVIGIPKNSIGEHLYHSKIYFDTESLFAWTVVVIVLSILFEKVLMGALRAMAGRRKS